MKYHIPVLGSWWNITTPTQDTNGHTVLDDSHQQFLYNSNGGQILQSVQLNQLETKKVIIKFSAEFSSDPLYQQQRNPSDDLAHSSLVYNYSSQHS